MITPVVPLAHISVYGNTYAGYLVWDSNKIWSARHPALLHIWK